MIRSCACMVWIFAYTARRAYKANSAYLMQYDLRDELYLYDELCLLDESVYSNQRWLHGVCTLYDKHYAGTSIYGFSCVLKARGYSPISFVKWHVSFGRMWPRKCRTESKAVVRRTVWLLRHRRHIWRHPVRTMLAAALSAAWLWHSQLSCKDSRRVKGAVCKGAET